MQKCFISEILCGLWPSHRNSYRRCYVKEYVLKNFANFAGKHLCCSFFFNKVVGLQAGNFIKKKL